MRALLAIAFVIVIVVAVRLSVYTVDASEYAYVTVLGRHNETLDGAQGGAGLHVGWPWPIQVVQRLDRRIQQFDLPATEFLTPDAAGKTVDKNLSVEAYVVWKITDEEAVDRFIRHIGTPDKAEAILGTRITGQLGSSLGKMRMDDIVNVEEGRVDSTMHQWHRDLLASLIEPVRKEYGIDLVDIRLRRFNYPGQTQRAIFERIQSERQKKAAEYQAEGRLQAQNIESKAEEESRKMLAEARYREELIKGQADSEVLAIRNQAHSLDPKFYAFLKEMEKLQSVLSDNRTVLLLSTHRALFDLLFQPPRPGHGTNPALPLTTPNPKGGK
jgi:modulator of FtsH protease HflC